MARPLREISSTGIYHVMLRGINRQVIFEHPVDYRKFIDLLCLMVSPSDELGRSLPSLCRIYAYCLMPNHIHMIIQEKSENLSTVIHRIATVKPMVLGIQATFNFTPRNAVMKSCRPLRNLGPVSSSCHVLQVLVKRSFAMQKLTPLRPQIIEELIPVSLSICQILQKTNIKLIKVWFIGKK